jgi:hypothetical protein
VKTVVNILAAGIVTCVASSTFGALVSLQGAHNAPTTGSLGPLGLNANTSVSFSSGTGNDRISGTIVSSNTSFNGGQQFGLSLTNFVFSGTGNTTQSVTIELIQDYVVDSTFVGRAETLAGAGMIGNVAFSGAGQLAQGSVQSMHECTNLPFVMFNPNGILIDQARTTGVSRGTGAATAVAVMGNVYRVAMCYTFTINANNGIVQINLAETSGASATLVLVPLPPAAWAGLGGLALAGGMRMVRRRKLEKTDSE